MMKQGLEIDGKEFFVIVKMEEGSVHYLCRNESSDIPSSGGDEISVDFIHVDVVKWSPVLDNSVYRTESLDEVAARLVFLSGYEGYASLIREEKLCIAELLPTYRCENVFVGSRIID